MEQSQDDSIASRTRSQTTMAQQKSSDTILSTQEEEIKENLTGLNIKNDNEDDTAQEDIKILQSLSTTKIENKESGAEQPNNILHSNVQLQSWQENIMTELAQKQKTIEEQQLLLVQLQSNIHQLMNSKHHQQPDKHLQELSLQALTATDDAHINSTSITFEQVHPPTNGKIQQNTSKHDNFIEQQLLKDKISNMKKFSGNKHDDVDEWLENIDHDFSSTLVSDDIKLKIIPKSLINNAEDWFQQNKHRLTSWKIFKLEIQHRFQSSLHKDEKFIRLRERKQQLKETGQQFIDSMEKLCFQVNRIMTEEDKILNIKAGLKASLKEKVLEKQPQSMQELRNIVKRVEDIEIMLNSENKDDRQMEHPSFSSNPNAPLTSNVEQPSSSSNYVQSSQDDSNCYAISSHWNNSHYRRNNYRYQNHQQRQMNRQDQRQNNSYATNSRYNYQWNQYQPNQGTQINSYPLSSTNNHSKKY